MLKRYVHWALIVVVFSIFLFGVIPKPRALSFANPPVFALGPAGIALPDAQHVLLATNLTNISTHNTYKVSILSIKLVSGRVTKPATFPFPIGEIDAGNHVVLQTAFNAPRFNPGGSLILLVQGHYFPTANGPELDPQDYDFTVTEHIILPASGPGSAS